MDTDIKQRWTPGGQGHKSTDPKHGGERGRRGRERGRGGEAEPADMLKEGDEDEC